MTKIAFNPVSPITLVQGASFSAAVTDWTGSSGYYRQLHIHIDNQDTSTPRASSAVVGGLPSLSVSTSTISVGTHTVYSRLTMSQFATMSPLMVEEWMETATLTITAPAPSVPSSITVPTEIKGGTQIPISWGTSTNVSSYQLERQINGGSWSQIYSGGNRNYTDTVPLGAWNTVAYRVKATGTGGTSGYRTSNTVPVINNSAPVISGTDANLGTLTSSFPAQSYTVTDAESDNVSVVEALDGITLRTYNVTLGAANSLALNAAQWLEVTNGSHSITITATDSGGLSAVRTFTFAKSVTTVELEQTEVLAADAQPTMGIVNVTGLFPAGSILQVLICNNGNDVSPTWQDISAYVLPEARKFPFTNSNKTAANWGVKLKVKLQRGTAPAGNVCALVSIGGNYK